jgi:hypothetical protein
VLRRWFDLQQTSPPQAVCRSILACLLQFQGQQFYQLSASNVQESCLIAALFILCYCVPCFNSVPDTHSQHQPQRPCTTVPQAALCLGQQYNLHQPESFHCCCTSQLIVEQSRLTVSDCRLAAAHKRDKYEARHMGNFRRIYPSSSAPLQAKYEWLLQGSARLFASSMKAKAHNTIGRIQVRLLLPASCFHWL